MLYNQVLNFSSTAFKNIICKDINKDHDIRKIHQTLTFSCNMTFPVLLSCNNNNIDSLKHRKRDKTLQELLHLLVYMKGFGFPTSRTFII